MIDNLTHTSTTLLYTRAVMRHRDHRFEICQSCPGKRKDSVYENVHCLCKTS